MNRLPDIFYVKNKDTYPPFKDGFYMEEYFLNYMIKNNKKYDKNGRLYIPALWTNFQIEGWFSSKKNEMQQIINKYIENNYNPNGYFTIVQYDDGPLLTIPNMIVYGACSGNIPLPLIYEDRKYTLENMPKKTYKEKEILCSFVGTITHTVRQKINDYFKNNDKFDLNNRTYWSAVVEKNDQDIFIEKTVNSKFVLASRGYGRSSFRFFEIFKLGSIPIYVWDDIEWLPYKDKIDYSKICISLNIKDIDTLESRLNIDEETYQKMIDNYQQIKHVFELEYMCDYIS